MKKSKWVLILALMLGFYACGDDDDDCGCANNNLSINVNATIDGDKNVVLGDWYLNTHGDSVKFSTLKMYISKIEFVKDNFDIVDVTDALLYDFENPNPQEFLIDAGTYQEVRFGIGVAPEFNNLDPATFPSEHPLSAENNMYWGWASMYKFFVTEGQFSTCFIEGTQNPKSFAYHSGTDTLYREVQLPKIFSVADNQITPLELNIDLDQVFQNVDMCDENSSHTLGDAAFQIVFKITQNLKNAFE